MEFWIVLVRTPHGTPVRGVVHDDPRTYPHRCDAAERWVIGPFSCENIERVADIPDDLIDDNAAGSGVDLDNPAAWFDEEQHMDDEADAGRRRSARSH